MANYVKFRRGSKEAFKLMPVDQLELDTLYFIYSEDEATADLYLGSRLISSGAADLSSDASALAALTDVVINENLASKDFLVYDANLKAWVNKNLEEAVSIMVGANSTSSGKAGLVPAPSAGPVERYLRSDGTWVTIDSNAEVNIINSVSNDFEIISENGIDRQLNLKPISVSKVANLESILNSKVDKVEGSRLITKIEADKLAKLSIDDEGNLGISQTINIENVQGLEDWLNLYSGAIKGLSENNLTNELYNKLTEALLIRSIDTNQLALNEGHLSVKEVDYSKVSGLNEILALKAEASEVQTVNNRVNELETIINNSILSTESRLEEIEERLIWQGL